MISFYKELKDTWSLDRIMTGSYVISLFSCVWVIVLSYTQVIGFKDV
jgi:hypothetical protein